MLSKKQKYMTNIGQKNMLNRKELQEMSVAIIMTVFNRLEKTTKCINDLEVALKDVPHKYFITNDGSSDGTDKYLKKIKKTISVDIYDGDGSLFWNKGMYFSYEKAIKENYTYYLWVNNDTEFYPDAWNTLLSDYEMAKKINSFSVICGAVQSAITGEITYGGTKAGVLICPRGSIEECTHINGNCLLIPEIVAQKIGNLDFRYEHGLGDFDYGQRILKECGKLYVSSKFVGTCEKNPIEGTWKDKKLSVKKRIQLMKSKTGQPRTSYKIYLKKWNKKNWLFYYYKPYFDIIFDDIKKHFNQNGD